MNVLEKIVADTRELLAERKRRMPLSLLQDRAFYEGPTLPLTPALRGKELRVIAECKKASPSKGVLRSNFDVAEIARSYKMGGAAALSILTEPLHFKGSLENLSIARKSVDLPLLRKDFIVDPYQLHEARAYGADAVLLIATILDRRQLAELHAEATSLHLSCLVEVYDEAELERIDFDQISILGINNRDLRTFEVDVDRSLRLFHSVPGNIIKVAESGLRSGGDLAYLQANGVHAALIGESFMRMESPGDALAAMLHAMRDINDGRAAPMRLVV